MALFILILNILEIGKLFKKNNYTEGSKKGDDGGNIAIRKSGDTKFLISKAKIAIIKLKKLFIKALIPYHFELN